MEPSNEKLPERSELKFTRPADDTLCVHFTGSWKMERALPSADEVKKQLDSGSKTRRITFDTKTLTAWDSGLVSFMVKVNALCAGSDVVIDQEPPSRGLES